MVCDRCSVRIIVDQHMQVRVSRLLQNAFQARHQALHVAAGGNHQRDRRLVEQVVTHAPLPQGVAAFGAPRHTASPERVVDGAPRGVHRIRLGHHVAGGRARDRSPGIEDTREMDDPVGPLGEA